MITFLGMVIFAVVVMIGMLDRNSGLRLLQKYESPWRLTGSSRGASERTRPRRSGDSA
jgi:hypothetical protein